ncbi:hypothetical protein GLE_2514 [Lysobacter enzymogenes]|uniref:Uncharacterized protein n=1 Tax=Lysobacter enzymogenes TaxID=69 RepID=A0A0S2DGV1_LYSEN|nr:hypothetical protein GLE_2514 [Lysobacter enzymogenes]
MNARASRPGAAPIASSDQRSWTQFAFPPDSSKTVRLTMPVDLGSIR